MTKEKEMGVNRGIKLIYAQEAKINLIIYCLGFNVFSAHVHVNLVFLEPEPLFQL